MNDVEWFTRYGSEGASSRYRSFQFESALRDLGFESSFSPLAPWKGTRVAQLRGVGRRIVALSAPGRRRDITVVQKEPIMPARLWPMVHSSVRGIRRLVWDVDDAIWLASSAARAMCADMARAATVSIAGNHLIAEWLQEHGAQRVVIVPTCYEPREFVRPEAADTAFVEVVWVGSPATSARLQEALPSLSRLLANPAVRLTCVGSPVFDVPGARNLRFVSWSEATEHEALSSADYGLSFLPRDDYSDHKCGFKLIQYMSYGVVPVATASPVHDVILGDIGVSVTTLDDLSAVEHRLQQRPSAAERNRSVERWRSHFSMSVGAAQLAEVFGQLMENR